MWNYTTPPPPLLSFGVILAAKNESCSESLCVNLAKGEEKNRNFMQASKLGHDDDRSIVLKGRRTLYGMVVV